MSNDGPNSTRPDWSDDTRSEASSGASFTTLGSSHAPAGLAKIQALGAHLRPIVAAARTGSAGSVLPPRPSATEPVITPDDSISVAGLAHTFALAGLSVEQVSGLLRALELGRYVGAFARLPMRGADLEHATDEDLREAGMNVALHRRSLLAQLNSLREGGVPASWLEPSQPPARAAAGRPQASSSVSDEVLDAVILRRRSSRASRAPASPAPPLPARCDRTAVVHTQPAAAPAVPAAAVPAAARRGGPSCARRGWQLLLSTAVLWAVLSHLEAPGVAPEATLVATREPVPAFSARALSRHGAASLPAPFNYVAMRLGSAVRWAGRTLRRKRHARQARREPRALRDT